MRNMCNLKIRKTENKMLMKDFIAELSSEDERNLLNKELKGYISAQK